MSEDMWSAADDDLLKYAAEQGIEDKVAHSLCADVPVASSMDLYQWAVLHWVDFVERVANGSQSEYDDDELEDATADVFDLADEVGVGIWPSDYGIA